MAENDPKTEGGEQTPPAKKTTSSRRNRRGGDNSATAIKSEKVRGQYASGVGWDAGQVAPSTKYVDMDGKVTDKEPVGGGHVLIAEGDVVREHMLPQLKSKRA
jgi:hypothetical protein